MTIFDRENSSSKSFTALQNFLTAVRSVGYSCTTLHSNPNLNQDELLTTSANDCTGDVCGGGGGYRVVRHGSCLG